MKSTISLLIALLLAVSLVACKKEQEAVVPAPAPAEQTAQTSPAEQAQAPVEQAQAVAEQAQAVVEQAQAVAEQAQAVAPSEEKK